MIVQEPENSTVTDNGDGTLTIVFNKVEEDKFFAPALVFVYKDAQGVIQEAKKEFVVTQEGDVPSLIQTGYVPDNNESFDRWLFIYVLISLTYFVISKRRRKELQK